MEVIQMTNKKKYTLIVNKAVEFETSRQNIHYLKEIILKKLNKIMNKN